VGGVGNSTELKETGFGFDGVGGSERSVDLVGSAIAADHLTDKLAKGVEHQLAVRVEHTSQFLGLNGHRPLLTVFRSATR
jgi:hypothetical protein